MYSIRMYSDYKQIRSGCQFSLFNHSTGACNLYTDGDTSECDDTTDDHQYVYRKESQTYVHVVPNTKGINWFDAQRVCLALGGRLSGYTASTSHDDVVASLGDNACWLGFPEVEFRMELAVWSFGDRFLT
ncbi:hypothetical protein DPMN_188640 [Dreissena polymorpha]|uniref:C-type lectin domain-containing protein n=1 Tax=Dreissena polymorpha TaxID=45954 RepID=A0A9D4IBI6_DREPO|nr:hypothetical protein DPMN_188640 [Dreissena polymorpha]